MKPDTTAIKLAGRLQSLNNCFQGLNMLYWRDLLRGTVTELDIETIRKELGEVQAVLIEARRLAVELKRRVKKNKNAELN